MPPDLEPASALASRVVGDLFDSTGERADVWRVEQLIESDRAFVREPLERRVRELLDENKRHLDRIASSEAQLASVREEALREAAGVARSALRGASRAYDAMIAEVQSGDDHELKVRFHRYAKDSVGAALAEVGLLIEQLSEPPAAQKEPL